MAKGIWKRIRKFLTGLKLAQSIKRNNEAADKLDALVREVLKR